MFLESTTNQNNKDRRIYRSDCVQEALDLQLAFSAERGDLGPVVLADDLGLIIASSGAESVCEYLAAISPTLSSGFRTWSGEVLTNIGNMRLSISPFRFGRDTLFLAALGGDGPEIPRELFMSGMGVVRILS